MEEQSSDYLHLYGFRKCAVMPFVLFESLSGKTKRLCSKLCLPASALTDGARGSGERERREEGGACPLGRLEPEVPAVPLDEFAAEIESQPRSGDLHRTCMLRLQALLDLARYNETGNTQAVFLIDGAKKRGKGNAR